MCFREPGVAVAAGTVFASLEPTVQMVQQTVGARIAEEVHALFTRTKVVKELSEAERVGQEVRCSASRLSLPAVEALCVSACLQDEV